MKKTTKPDPAQQLSKEQQSAVDALGEAQVCVSAGAGSGKTRVLVAAYLRAVTELRASPQSVLAVTFTKKAAYEMKERLALAFARLGRDDLRRDIESAWIGTIDSFCTRILRENPVECGVDPAFSVLGELEAGLLMRRTLEVLLQEEGSNAVWTSWTALHGEKAGERAFRSAYSLFRNSGGDERFFDIRRFDEETARARTELARSAASIKVSLSAPTTQAETKLKAAALRIEELLSQKNGDAWAEIGLLQEAVGKGKIERRGEAVKEAVEELEEGIALYTRLRVQELSTPVKAEFRRLFFLWKDRYEAEKRRLAALDFNDLLFYVHAAFSGKSAAQQGVRRHYQDFFRFILVDEFQDTSRIQGRILELLKRPEDLFVVGDIQQSIYRFRQADPDIFRAVRKASTVRPLCENYRSQPGILHFVNGLFEPLFGEEFQALVPKEKSQGAGCLELIQVPQPKGMPLNEARVLEAGTIARRITELVREGFAYGDIVILMRASTNSRFYEKELVDAGIPYYLQKGRGFYEQHEVQDLLNFLRLLENAGPENDVAAAAVLRSPLVQLSDEGLFWLGDLRKQKKLGAFMDAAASYQEAPGLSTQDKEKLEAFWMLLNEARQSKDGRKISEVLETLLRRTAYEASLLTRPDGPQASANVRKLMDLASQADEALSGAQDFVDWIKRLSEEASGESEARLAGEKEDVVRLLTVHSAKGLEFPVVFLADMGSKKKNEERPPFLMDVEHGLGARMRGDADGDYEDETYNSIFEGFESANDAESLRLLYVALTRAKTRLVLCGALAEKKAEEPEKGGRTWMELVMPHLDGAKNGSVLRHPIGKAPLAAPAEPVKEPAKKPDAKNKAWLMDLEKRLEPTAKPYETLEDLTVTAIVAEADKKQGKVWEPEEAHEEEPGDDELLPRNEYGSIFHRLMELSVKYGSGMRLSQDIWDDVVSVLGAEEKKEIKESFERFWKTPLGAELKKASKLYPELPFIYKTRHGILKGQMDLVYQRPDGGWVILDYKTNLLSAPGDKEAAIQTYSWQLGLYALSFWKLYGEIPKKTSLYFTSTNEEEGRSWSEPQLEQLSGELEELYRAAVRA